MLPTSSNACVAVSSAAAILVCAELRSSVACRHAMPVTAFVYPSTCEKVVKVQEASGLPERYKMIALGARQRVQTRKQTLLSSALTCSCSLFSFSSSLRAAVTCSTQSILSSSPIYLPAELLLP